MDLRRSKVQNYEDLRKPKVQTKYKKTPAPGPVKIALEVGS